MWSIHHVNLPTWDVRGAAAFYKSVLGMDEIEFPYENKHGVFETALDWVALYDDGIRQLHVCRPQARLGTDNGFCLNPVLKGHVAINVDDLSRIRKNLRRRDLYFVDAGKWSLEGYEQLYFYDLSLNVVEVNMRVAEKPETEPEPWSLHHATVRVEDVRADAELYAEVFDLDIEYVDRKVRGLLRPESDVAVLFQDHNGSELHMERPNPVTPEDAHPDRWSLHPFLHGHYSLAVPDFDGVRDRLADAGALVLENPAGEGIDPTNVYCYDAGLNVLELRPA